MKYVILVIIGLFLLSSLGSAMNLITIPWLKFDRQVQMNRDIVTKTYTADNAIYNHHWFTEMAESIKATEKKVEIAKESVDLFPTLAGDRKDWTFEDKNEYARLSAVLSGLKSHYEDIVGEYNARANQADRAIFQNGLPLFYSLNAY
jgi:Guanylate-binding protein, N-terminal domain